MKNVTRRFGDWQHTWEERHAQQIWLKVGQFWANIKLNMTKIILFADLFSSANSTKCQNCMFWNSNTLCLMSHHMLKVSNPDILSAQMDTWYHAWSTRTIYTNITENNTWYFHLGDVNVEQREKSGMSFSRKRRSIPLVCTTYNVYNAHIEYVLGQWSTRKRRNILLVWWSSFPNHFSKLLCS